jgi:hypothetical protein
MSIPTLSYCWRRIFVSSFLKSPHATSQTLASALSKIDDLLASNTQKLSNGRILQRQIFPQLSKSFGQHIERLGDLPNRGNAPQREQSRAVAPICVLQVQQERGSLSDGQLLDFDPKPSEIGALVNLGFYERLINRR